MSNGYKHSSKWSFGDTLYHRMTGDKGMVLAITLRPGCPPNYIMVFEDSRQEDSFLEFELTDEQPSVVKK